MAMEQENFSISSGKRIANGISSFDFIPREIENILNLLRSNAEPEIYLGYIEFLKELTVKNDLVNEEAVEITKDIKECLNLSSSFLENDINVSSDRSIIYIELYCILSIIVLNFLNIDDIEYNNIAFNSITKCSKLLKCFNCRGNYEKSEYYAKKCKEILTKFIDKCNDGFVSKILEDKKMTIDLYYIETLSNIGRLDESFDEIQKLKERLTCYTTHQRYFVNICFNTSIKFYKKKQCDYAIKLLETAYNVALEAKQSLGDISFIPQLLTHIYMKENPASNWQKCLQIFNLLKERDIPVITFVPDLLSAAFFSGNQNVITDILNHFHKLDFSTALLSEIIEKLNGKGYHKVAVDFLQKTRGKPIEMKEKLCLLGLELEISFKTCSLEKASVLLEDAIKLVKSANITLRQSNCFCKVLFSYTDGLYKSKSFMQCLTWYKKFLKFVEYTKINDRAIYYLKQRICLCYLEMNEGQLAKNMLMKIELPNQNTNNLQLHLTLQTAIMCEDQDLADTALYYIGRNDHQMEEILLAGCRKALSVGKTSFICKILEVWFGKFNVIDGNIFHLKLSQILIKLYLGSTDVKEEQEKILVCLRKALEITEYVEKGNNIEDTMEWFCQIAWNMALNEGTDNRNVFGFFDVCCQFLEKLKGSHLLLKKALIFVVAAGIQTLRENIQEQEMEECRNISRKILISIEKCRNIEKENQKILCMLYVYEFEVKILMEDPAAEAILKKMLLIPFVDAEALQLAASIAYEKSSNNFALITAALEGALSKKTDDRGDVEISQIYHSLLQVLFFTQEYVTSSVEEQTMNICQTVIKKLEDGSLEEYPEMKILSLMTKCWNWGVHKISAANSTSGHQWCLVAMKLLQKLKGLKHLHEEKLQALFSSYFGTYDM